MMPIDVTANCQIFLPTALELLKLGAVPVLLGVRDKRPIWKNWQQWGLTGELVITEAILHHWHEGQPGHNVGMALGHGWIAIDIDHLEAVEAIVLGLVPTGAPAKRARRGYTLIFRDDPADPVRKTRTFLHPVSGDMLVEVLALGRQTVMPPSIHPEGMAYEWMNGAGLSHLATAPMIGQRHIDAIEAALGAAGLTKMRHQRKGVVEDFQGRRDRYSAWLDVKLRDKLAAVRGAVEGGRQQALNDAVLPLACFIRVGLVDETKLRAAMEDACEENGYMRAHGFSRFSRDFDKAVTDGWDMSLPALDTPMGEVDQTAASRMGTAPEIPIMPTGGPVVELSHLTRVNVADLLKTEAPAREWTWPDWIPHKQVTLVYGDGGTGKTTLLLQLAILASMGLGFMGGMLARRRVLFISAEDELPELHYRLAQMCRALGCDGDNIEIITLVELEDTELACAGVDGKIKATALMDRVVSACQGFDMVIMDPVADLFGGSDVDKRQVRGFIQMIRRRIAFDLKASVLIAAHPSQEGMKTGKGTSGSVAWSNSVKSRLYFERLTDDVMRLSLAKANRAKAGAEKLMKWVNGIFLPADRPSEVKPIEVEGRPRELLIEEVRKRPFVYRQDHRATMWIGTVAGPILGIDYTVIEGKRKITKIMDQMIAEGVFKVELVKEARNGQMRPVINVTENIP